MSWFHRQHVADASHRLDPTLIGSLACSAGLTRRKCVRNRGVNPKVAFIRLCGAQTYTAGEANRIGATPKTDPAPEGMKWQLLTFLGDRWGKGTEPRYNAERLIPYVKEINAQGGCITFDVPASAEGEIPESFMKVLRSLNKKRG